MIVHIVTTDSFGTILINPRDNFSDAYLAAEQAEEEKESAFKLLSPHHSPSVASTVNVNSLSMKPELIIGRMKSTSERMSKIRIRLDPGRAQWVIETDDAAIRKIVHRHKKKGKVEGAMLENSGKTTTLRVKKVSSPLHDAGGEICFFLCTVIYLIVTSSLVGRSLSPSRAAELLSTSRTFGAISKLPPALIAQTLPLRRAEAALSRSMKINRSASPEAADRESKKKPRKLKKDAEHSQSAAQFAGGSGAHRSGSSNSNKSSSNNQSMAQLEDQYDELGEVQPRAGSTHIMLRAHTSGHSYGDVGLGEGARHGASNSSPLKLPSIKRNVVSS